MKLFSLSKFSKTVIFSTVVLLTSCTPKDELTPEVTKPNVNNSAKVETGAGSITRKFAYHQVIFDNKLVGAVQFVATIKWDRPKHFTSLTVSSQTESYYGNQYYDYLAAESKSYINNAGTYADTAWYFQSVNFYVAYVFDSAKFEFNIPGGVYGSVSSTRGCGNFAFYWTANNEVLSRDSH